MNVEVQQFIPSIYWSARTILYTAVVASTSMDGAMHYSQHTCDVTPHLAVSEELLLQADVAHPADEALHLQSAPSTGGQTARDPYANIRS